MDLNLRQIARGHAELVTLRLAYSRERRSHLARQQYADGYRAALEDVGRRPTTMERHPQVDLHGVDVDAGMTGLLEALWRLDVDTQFSCQGHPDRYIVEEPGTHDAAAHVVFADVAQAFKFVTKTVELLGYTPWHDGVIVLTVMAPIDSEATRARVAFPPALLEEVTSAWVTFERSLPRSTKVP